MSDITINKAVFPTCHRLHDVGIIFLSSMSVNATIEIHTHIHTLKLCSNYLDVLPMLTEFLETTLYF